MDDRDLELHAHGHLGKAEGQILYLRLLGMLGWALILFRDGVPAGVAPIAIYCAGLLYTVFAHWRVRSGGDVAATARLTSVGDPILVTAMCSVTGGITAPFFPFYYFTLLATILRYGATRTVWVLGFHAALIVCLFALLRSTQPIGDLFVALFHLAFSAALGAMLAGWAQDNLVLALDRSERARALTRRLIRSQDQERQAVAGELHDRMSGHLFALRQAVDVLPADATTGALGRAVSACSNDVRAMMNELHPTVLDDLGFCSALEEYVDGLEKRGAVSNCAGRGTGRAHMAFARSDVAVPHRAGSRVERAQARECVGGGNPLRIDPRWPPIADSRQRQRNWRTLRQWRGASADTSASQRCASAPNRSARS